MFLHLREKTKFIRYDRCNRFILTKRRKKDASAPVVFPRRRFVLFSIFPIFTKPRIARGVGPAIRQILPIVPIFLKERNAVGR